MGTDLSLIFNAVAFRPPGGARVADTLYNFSHFNELNILSDLEIRDVVQ